MKQTNARTTHVIGPGVVERDNAEGAKGERGKSGCEPERNHVELRLPGVREQSSKRNRRDALERQGEALGWPFIYSVMHEKPSTRPVVASNLAYARSDADLCTRETHPSPSTWAPSGPAACEGCQCATERRHPKPMPNWVSLGPIKRRIQRAEL